MGYATLGFAKGPAIKFRIDPNAIAWNFQVNTSVANTIGGRVVQVVGATLSDIVISGDFGEDVKAGARDGTNEGHEHSGRSWRIQQRFTRRIREMMEYQARDARQFNKMAPPATFSYAPRGWRFKVYIRDIADPDGGQITISTGKFSHSYVLTLFVVQEGSDALVKAGSRNGVLNKARQKAINDYIGRLSDGIGWRPTAYNGNFADYYGGQGLGDYDGAAVTGVMGSAEGDDGG